VKAEISKFIVTLNRLSHRAKAVQFLFLCFVSLLFACSASLYLGSDIGNDLKNYHFYNAWALLNNRSEIDLFAAGMHTYFQPLLELPYYWLSFVWFPNSPKLATFLMGIPGGTFIILTFLIVFSILKSATQFPRIFLYVLSIPFGVFGLSYSFLLQVGYTSGDMPVASFVLGAIYALLRYSKILRVSSIISGVLIGIAVGLKFTAIAYSLPLFLAVIVFFPRQKQKRESAILFLLGCGTAFLITYGWWGWKLFQETGNPIFPVFDNFYPKWIYPTIVGEDAFSLLCRPNGLLKKSYNLLSLYHFGPVNICIGISLLIFILKKLIFVYFCPSAKIIDGETRNVSLMWKIKKLLFSQPHTNIYLSILIFYFGTLFIWRLYLSEPRYIMALDALSGILILLGILRLRNFQKREILPLFFLFISFFIVLKKDFLELELYSPRIVKNIHNTRGWRFSGKELPPNTPVLPENTLILTGMYTSFLAPFLTQKTTSLSFVGGVSDFNTKRPLPPSIIKDKITQKIKLHNGPIYLLTTPGVVDSFVYTVNLRDAKGRLLREINYFPQYGLRLEHEKQISFSNKFGDFLLIPARLEMQKFK
jgi:hypothetical protein